MNINDTKFYKITIRYVLNNGSEIYDTIKFILNQERCEEILRHIYNAFGNSKSVLIQDIDKIVCIKHDDIVSITAEAKEMKPEEE